MADKSLDQYYLKYAKDVFRYLLSLSRDRNVAEDITQDTFYRVDMPIEEFSEYR